MGRLFKDFYANPIFLWSHDGRAIPIARTVKVERTKCSLKFTVERNLNNGGAMHFESLEIMKQALEDTRHMKRISAIRQVVDQVCDGLELLQNEFVLLNRSAIRETK